MKKMFVSLFLCMALSFSLTVSASAYTIDDLYKQVTAIKDELGYPQGNYSSLRRAINYIADNLPNSYNYTTVLSNIKDNTDLLYQYIKLIEGDTNSITARATEIFNKLNDVYLRQGQMQIAITDHIDSASSQNHSDLSSFKDSNHSDFLYLFNTVLDPSLRGSSTSSSGSFLYPIRADDGSILYLTWGNWLFYFFENFTRDSQNASGVRSFYGLVSQLQQVLASDDDLALKKDNKANEEAVTSGFVNGSSSKTSLGTSDFANLKDIGGSFNDLSSLNGQSSVGSFTSGLSSADEVGQGWFSEATRASLDAVTPANSRAFRSLSRSSVYSISADASVRRAPSPDIYNMDGFEQNYAWLWGDAS